MTFKSNGRKRSTKKLLSSFMCLVISLGFFYFLYRYGFKIGNLTFGIIFAYLSSAFFRTSNDPKNPEYDDDTTSQRKDKYYNIFKNTYLERPNEYIGAMARAKRYGAELGFDTTSPDPAKARAAMT
jgi:hypothetical protein